MTQELFESECPICHSKWKVSMDSVVGVNFDFRDEKVPCSLKCWDVKRQTEVQAFLDYAKWRKTHDTAN